MTIHARAWIIGSLLLSGCDEIPISVAPKSEAPIDVLAQSFDRADTGKIEGRVLWNGDVPALEPVLMKVNAYHNCLHKTPVLCVPPHQPKVDRKNGGVANAVVLLRHVDPRRSRPWDHGDVRIEFRDRQMDLRQGENTTSAAFVKRGASIEAVNRDVDYHALRGRGADLFSLPLIKPNQPGRRMLAHAGIIDLTSGAGYYWQHAHLFVVAHPYYARTDAEGRFVLDQVPAGTYELVCWMPSWIVTRKEIDPETAITARLVWAPPQEQRQTVRVLAGGVVVVDYCWSRAHFEN